MGSSNSIPFMQTLTEFSKKQELKTWEGTLKDYLDLIIRNPSLHMNAHARVLRMIESAGIERGPDGEVIKYNFFGDEIFGSENSIEELVSYLRAAAAGSEVGRRILLLYGPTSSGKSQMAILLKKGLEKFSKTDEGAIYCLSDSPMNEDPLIALPHELRGDFYKETGIKIEGELSPIMSVMLKEKYGSNFLDLPVKRYFISEKERKSIGTFVPSDKKSQDISELIGSMDLSTIGQYGSESDPRAYKFDGELNVANRGIMEFIEMLKVDQKFLYVLLTLAQEKNIKTSRFPLIYADEFILAHSIVGDEPVPYKKDGVVKFDTISNLTRKNDTNIEVIAMNMESKELQWTKVKNFYSHPFTGNLIKTIQKDGVIETTYNHSIYSKDLELSYPEDMKPVFAARRIPNFESITSFSLDVTSDMEIDEFGYARISDVLGYKGNGQYRKNKVKVKYDIFNEREEVLDILRVLAWYITEGHMNSEHCIISQQNIEELYKIKESVERIGTSVASIQDRRDSEDKTSRIHISSRVWKEIIENMCGKYSTGKKIPDFIYNLPKEFVSFFLDEMIKGDGSKKFYHNGSEEYKNGFFRYKTVSKTLAAQVGFLSTLIGKNYSVSHGYTSTGKDAYEIRFRLEETSSGKNKIEKLYVEALEVFDIACEGNNSFVAGVGSILCHNTNESEYRKFLGKEEMEALHDRLIIIKVPYNLKVSDEVKIYEKLISQAEFKNVHISPHALHCAAMFAVMSRLKESANKNLDVVGKMKLYNGEEIDGFTLNDVSGLSREFGDEGMSGISPRYIINRISSILSERDVKCVTPIDVIRAIRDGFHSNAKLDTKEIARLENILTKVIDEYSKIAKNEVQKAFFLNFEEEVKNLLLNYLDNASAYLDGSKIENDLGQMVEPNEKLMRSIEEKIQVTDSGKKSFRQEISRKMAKSALTNGGVPNYKDHAKLKEALQRQLFEDRQDIIRLTISTRVTDENALKKLNVVIETLSSKYGYTADSANKLLKYVSSIMART